MARKKIAHVRGDGSYGRHRQGHTFEYHGPFSLDREVYDARSGEEVLSRKKLLLSSKLSRPHLYINGGEQLGKL